MTTTADAAEPAPDPARTWRDGQRFYISTLDPHLRSELVRIGAHWDDDRGAYWVGLAKRRRAEELIASARQARALAAARAAARAAQAEEARARVRARGLWLDIPHTRADARRRARDLGAVIDPTDPLRWAFPNGDARAEVAAMLDTPTQPGEVDHAAVAAAAGRTVIGDHRTDTMCLYGSMRAAQARGIADAMAGRRIVILGGVRHLVTGITAVNFIPVGEGHRIGAPHWDITYTAVPVAPTPAEQVEDAADADARADARTIGRLLRHAERATNPRWHPWSYVPPDEMAGMITAQELDQVVSRLILTRDGRVIWQGDQHEKDPIWQCKPPEPPQRLEGESRDPALATQVAEVLSDGPGMIQHDYMIYTVLVTGRDGHG